MLAYVQRLVFAAIILATTFAGAQSLNVPTCVNGVCFAKFTALTATGTTATLTLPLVATTHAVQLSHTVSTPTGCTYDTEVSLDGSVYVAMTTATACTTTGTITWTVDKPVRFIRFNLKTLSGGTNPAVQFTYLGK